MSLIYLLQGSESLQERPKSPPKPSKTAPKGSQEGLTTLPKRCQDETRTQFHHSIVNAYCEIRESFGVCIVVHVNVSTLISGSESVITRRSCSFRACLHLLSSLYHAQACGQERPRSAALCSRLRIIPFKDVSRGSSHSRTLIKLHCMFGIIS